MNLLNFTMSKHQLYLQAVEADEAESTRSSLRITDKFDLLNVAKLPEGPT